jgi:hypothetical protein
MDLEKQTKIIPSSNSVDQPTEVSLFDAIRKWTDAEGVDAYYIELDGKRLTPEQIQAIAHSGAYKDRLLAFNERLAWMMTKAKAPTKSTKAPPEGHHRLDGTSPKLKSIGGFDYGDRNNFVAH